MGHRVRVAWFGGLATIAFWCFSIPGSPRLHAQSSQTQPSQIGSQPQRDGGFPTEGVDTGLQTGISLTQQGRFQEAIPVLESVREQGDHSFAVEFDLALCYVGTGRYATAVEILKKINELGTTIIITTHNKGVVDAVGRRVITIDRGRLVRDDASGQYIL